MRVRVYKYMGRSVLKLKTRNYYISYCFNELPVIKEKC